MVKNKRGADRRDACPTEGIDVDVCPIVEEVYIYLLKCRTGVSPVYVNTCKLKNKKEIIKSI